MEMFFDIGPLWGWSLAFVVAICAGLVKGVVGFAMPTVLIAGLSTMMPPDLALAGLILPTLATNLWQALRQGIGAALASVARFRVFLLAGGAVMVLAAQAVPRLPPAAMFLFIGPLITAYALSTLMGRGLRLSPEGGLRGEAGMGALAGLFGGLSGIWGPPTVAMLMARGTEKREQMRVQGVIYGLGAVLLLVSHLGSGVLRTETLPLSLGLVPPALLGIGLGFWLQDKFDQETFRKVTLWVLLIAGINLIRRGVLML
ncbi:Sulfite exporter TauE/SafE [Roseovarius tolerans]|uniref:Probable membrane transporter protein n=1 Tax=Roseovarius tolerans TaxID=74031 RepID=A0A0L6CYC5_9RHOB|nr:sulfite exporter TauE/SafE family protein [Roseovarius tolerans]KNX42726.1 Sulfite exporter TauE/SafE [Roseovarius tolerans]